MMTLSINLPDPLAKASQEAAKKIRNIAYAIYSIGDFS